MKKVKSFAMLAFFALVLCKGGRFFAAESNQKTTAQGRLNFQSQHLNALYSTDFKDKKAYGAALNAFDFDLKAGTLLYTGLFNKFSRPQLTLSSSGYSGALPPKAGPKVYIKSTPVLDDRKSLCLSYTGLFDTYLAKGENKTYMLGTGKTFLTPKLQQIQLYLATQKIQMKPTQPASWHLGDPYFKKGDFLFFLGELKLTGKYITTYNLLGISCHPIDKGKYFFRTQNQIKYNFLTCGFGFYTAQQNLVTAGGSISRVHNQMYFNPTINFIFLPLKAKGSMGLYGAVYQKQTTTQKRQPFKQGKITFGLSFSKKHSSFSFIQGANGIELDQTAKSLSNSQIDRPSFDTKLSYKIYSFKITASNIYTPQRKTSYDKDTISLATYYNITQKLPPLNSKITTYLYAKGSLTLQKKDIYSKTADIGGSLKFSTKHLSLYGKINFSYSF